MTRSQRTIYVAAASDAATRRRNVRAAKVRPEHVDVLELHGRDDRHRRGKEVRRVAEPSEAAFDDERVAPQVERGRDGRRGEAVEPRRGRERHHVRRPRLRDRVRRLGDARGERASFDFGAVDAQPLLDAHGMRRRHHADAVPRRLERRAHQRADGALALRARDVRDRSERRPRRFSEIRRGAAPRGPRRFV